MRKKNGFTLIELLVVIAIIALLLSILMPALKLAKEKGKAILCKANLKGYHLAMKLYLDDNDSKFPNSFTSIINNSAPDPLSCQWHNREANPGINIKYAGPLWPYLNTMKSSLCPTFRGFAKFSGHTSCSVDYDPQYSYSQNNYLGKTYGVLKETQVTRSPDNILMFVEETIWTITEGAPTIALAPQWILNDMCFMARHPLDSSLGDTIATYHGTSTAKPNKGKGNTVFIDGHVELSDPWDTEVIGGKEFRRSYLLSFPKRGAKSPTKPY